MPVVSYRVGGVPEQIRHRDTGLLAEPESVDGLKSCIRDLLLDHELRHKLGQTAREVVVHEYNRSKIDVRYRELYEKILRGKSPDNQKV